MIERGIRICWVAAGEVYGRSGDFRAACRAALLSYVVIIPCDCVTLHARIAEAEREGWTGEAEGLRVSLAAATSKIAQADATAARRAEHVHLGIPAYRDIAATTLTAEGPHEHR